MKKRRKKRVYNLDRRIIGALRRVFFYGPLRTQAAKLAKVEGGGYECKECRTVSGKAIIDHIRPVVDPKKGFSGWSNYIKRLFCSEKGLQNLCKSCHDAKSLTERRIRQVVKGGGA